ALTPTQPGPERCRQGKPPAMRVMLPIEQPHRAMELAQHRPWTLPGGSSLQVDDHRVRHVVHPAPLRLEPETDVQVVAVHEEVFVEVADRLTALPIEEQRRPGAAV